MSPALLKKYLAAARLVADHLVLKPEGFVFAPHPAVTDTDRDKYCVQRIIAFYQRHAVDYADYFMAAWRFQHRAALGKPNASLGETAAQAGISSKYLGMIWSLLTKTPSTSGPLADVQAAWRELPAHADKQAVVRHACERLRDLVIQRRKEFAPRVERLQVKGISPGSQPFLLWRNDQLARQHMRYSGDRSAPDAAELALFCRVFPDAFVVSERAPYYDASTS